MNPIRNMFNEFLELFGYKHKRLVEKELLVLKKAYNLAIKEGYNEGYNDGVTGSPHRYDRTRKVTPDTIVLFIKADRAATIIDCVRKNGSLLGVNGNQLVSDTFRIWVGTYRKYQNSGIPAIFTTEGEVSDIGREYDSVAIKLPYPNCAPIIDSSSDSYAIGQIIRVACEQGLRCEGISNRLPFSRIEPLFLIEL